MPYFIEEDDQEQYFDDTSYSFSHYGQKRRSGKNRWGTGKIPYQHEPWFTWSKGVNYGWGKNDLYNNVQSFKKWYKKENGTAPTDTEIARALHMTRTEYDPAYRAAKNDVRLQKILFVEMCQDPERSPYKRPMSTHEIELYTLKKYGKAGRIPENTALSLLDQGRKARTLAAGSTANFLREQVKEKGMIDVGEFAELYVAGGISRTKFNEALKLLKDEGYLVYGRHVDQVTNPKSNNKTVIQVLCPPGTPKNILFTNLGDVKSIGDYHAEMTENGETKFWKMEYPSSMDSKRIKVIYGDEGGKDRDGWIFLRRGCKDLDLGNSLYAQVRILVDGTHYIKGMASYYDGEMPEGIDVIFNSNKPKGTPLTDPNPDAKQVLKPIEHDDPNNPFGALIKEGTGQYHYQDENGEWKLGLINKKSEEGDWGDWRKTLSAQFTSKQNEKLIKSQIDISLANKRAEFEAIKQIENVVLKRDLLMKFASSCDSDAVDLRTGPMPGESFQVLVPIPSLKVGECYAPQYETGTKVALVRYPHADISEIPYLTVNNKNKEGLELLGKNAKDCIGLGPDSEAQLSGADNDGDAVMVIPIRENTPPISHSKPLEDMVGFDPAISYPYRPATEDSPGSKIMPKKMKQREMGAITNLIMDMKMQGADGHEMARAIKHSMVVIDAVKHKYDYKLSETDNRIRELIEKYQVQRDAEGNVKHIGGATTLLTKARSMVYIDKRVGQPKVDKETGEWIYTTAPDDKLYWTDYKTGKVNKYQERVPAMSLVKNAYELMSNPDPAKANKKEVIYADYANALKAMANEARKLAWYGLEEYQYSKEAAAEYAAEVSSLMSKINLANRNTPRERLANLQAVALKEKIIDEHPELKERTDENKKKLKKIAQQAIVEKRSEFNAKRVKFDITEREWEAISKHALDKQSLEKIFKYGNEKQIRQYSTPKENSRALTNAQINLIKNYVSNGWSYAEIAAAMGISKSTVDKYAKG